MRHGFVLIDKPVGPTSHDIVSEVRRVLGEKKIGHLGTLDPAATGLLVLAVGAKALKVIELFHALPKEYEASIRFGAVSTTYDREGVIEEVPLKPGVAEPDKHAIMLALKDKFLGKVRQRPPAHSAININGERAYKKARAGKTVSMPEREITIDACDVVSYSYPDLVLRVRCGSGTYIRSIAHDLGQLLRCGGYLSGLRRTMVGEWSVDAAADPEKVAWAHVLPLKEILKEYPRLELTAEEEEYIRHGRPIAHRVQPDTIAWYDDLPIAILTPLNDDSQQAKGRKVF